MNILVRKVGKYLEVIIEDGNVKLDLGLLNAPEAKNVRDEFVSAIDELNWYIQTQET